MIRRCCLIYSDPDIDDLIANLVNNVDSNGDGVIDIEEAGNNLGLLIDTNGTYITT